MEGQEGDHEWTKVARMPQRGRPPSQAQRRPDAETDAGSHAVKPNPGPQLSAEDIRKYHDGMSREWQASDCCKAVRKLVVDLARKHEPVSKAICLGPGSFDPADGGWQRRRVAHMQVLAFRTLVDELGGCRSTVPTV
jgi:hypothetical protein